MTDASFSTIAEFKTALDAAITAAPGPDAEATAAARARDAILTKPPGALGRLEELAIWYAGWRADPRPEIRAPQAIVFAGEHGVAALGVSAFPPDVTAQMTANFEAGGAAINQLAALAGAKMGVVPLEIGRPTADFTEGPAMTEAELCAALSAGWAAVDPASDLVMVGEMGIGNTTSAAALVAQIHGGGAAVWVGRGTGVDDDGLARKIAVVEAGLAQARGATPLEALRRLGGREIAAMSGAIAAARAHRIPVILDGFICGAAASVLAQTAPSALAHCKAGHVSAERAHRALLSLLGMAPILDLGLRLGEGSGAATAALILRAAIACHSGMATFAEAGVSDG